MGVDAYGKKMWHSVQHGCLLVSYNDKMSVNLKYFWLKKAPRTIVLGVH